jgi:ArsR family transcriptional regulator
MAAAQTLTIFDVSRYTLDMDMTTRSRPIPVRPADDSPACCGAVPAPIVQPLSAPQTTTATDRLKALADPTRLRMLELLASQPQPLCVCDITSQFALHQPTISHHLGILRRAGLIDAEKRGVWTFYWATEAGERALSAVRAMM